MIRSEPAGELSVIIVDDERVARARLRRLLSDEPDVRIVAECDNGKEAVSAILEHAPHLVFLDIEMPELSGFQVLESLPAGALPAFVFVTAFDEYALAAFAANALDYLLKPFDAERFLATMVRARERLRMGGSERLLLAAIRELADAQREMRAALSQQSAAPGGGGSASGTRFVDRIAVRSDGRVTYVRVDDVDYIESAANYVRLHAGADVHLVREPLGTLGARLDPSRFARIHRGTIVSVDRIKEIQSWFSGDALVILRSGAKLRLSRLYRSSLDLGARSRV